MTARRPLILGNWKMNLSLAEATALARDLKRQVATFYAGPETGVCPSYPHLVAVRELLEGSTIGVGAQEMVEAEPGAFTGGVCAEQLRELDMRWVLVGHSERRQYCGETDDGVAAKIRAAFRVGLTPVACFGETLAEREGGQTEEVVARQVGAALEGLSAPQIEGLVLAYEPVWAIGTGLNAEVDDVKEVHRLLRGLLAERGGGPVAESVRILYGGSVKPQNIAAYMACEDVDGALVGGASLDAGSFVQLLRYQEDGA